MLINYPMAPTIPAKDIDRAKKFYVEKLGLPEPKNIGPGHLLFKCGGDKRLVLYQREGGSNAKHTLGGWLVDDIESTVKQLRTKGIDFEEYDMPNLKTDENGIAEIGQIKSAWFKDSEGNILSINAMPE